MQRESEAAAGRRRDFRVFWAGQSVTLLGAQVSYLALPLVASLSLGASPSELGMLGALGALPALLLGLLAGSLIDQLPRRPLMIASDLLRAAVLIALPLLFLAGTLSLTHLAIAVVLLGIGGVVYDIAYSAFLPTLLDQKQLVEGNSRLELSRTAAEATGPGLAGVLIERIGAPVTLLIDACSFLGSALSLTLIRAVETTLTAPVSARELWADLRVGARFVWDTPILRAALVVTGMINFSNALIETVAFIYVPRSLGLGAGLFGLVLSLGSLGSLLGALVAPRLARRNSVGALLMGGLALVGLGDLLTALAGGPGVAIMGMLAVAAIVFGLGLVIYRVTLLSLRQAMSPETFQGRVGAVFYTVALGVVPAGALLGGLLGESIGLRETLILGACGELATVIAIWCSPLRRA